MILAALAGALLSQIAFKDDAVVVRGPVTLGQVADLSALPIALRGRASDLALMERPGKATAIPHRALAGRARSLMPALRPWLGAAQSGVLRFSPHYDARPGQLIVAGAPEAARGARVAVVTQAGPFRIERRGTLVQDADGGARAFVRFVDGSVVSAACCR